MGYKKKQQFIKATSVYGVRKEFKHRVLYGVVQIRD